MFTAKRPKERLEHTVLARAFVTADKDGMVYLDVRVLYLERHSVKDVIQLCIVRHQIAAMLKPRLNVMVCNLITGRYIRAGVCPPVAVDQPVARHQNVIAGGKRHRCQCRRTAILAALVKIDG